MEAHRRASVSPWIRVGLDPTWKLVLTCVKVKKEELNRGGGDGKPHGPHLYVFSGDAVRSRSK